MDRKKELKYFNIGKAFGGNQKWMKDPWMHIGGCAALTTCDAFIYLALYRGRRELYDYDPRNLTKKDYVRFGMSMKPYLRPRETGIKDLDTYIYGVKAYLEDVGAEDIGVRGFRGSRSWEEAGEIIKKQIDEGIPVPYLMLKHRDKAFDFFEWHWFLVIGYEEREEGLYIKAATYGKPHILPMRQLWNTGYEEKGGLIIFSI